ncbi:putative methyltransferase [Microbispora cellulosiformans]|uniref:Putative methyltransferase n=1 Tax=Microbispora cellulosiformans TaxID=2614688 RepID=A0A5J5K948_9ACTN|nr:bis-aminopropyl spermidine synthase family protein [Microbispora cellulosiformans]KAA9379969.1 putative methyltransferase [Microbispora cellulosiformans]
MGGHEAIDELLAEAGVDGLHLRGALALLSGGRWWTLSDLVRETATPRRTIESLLRVLPLEHSGDRVRIPMDQVNRFNAGVEPEISDLGNPVSEMVPEHAETLARLERLIAEAPRGRHALDHVSATAETVLRRALLLGRRFWLPGARLLCVGDHDLTSLAVRMVHPEVEVAVADIDDRILEFIDAQDLGVRTRWADLRLGLPPSLRGWADLAITDPPYTPEGIGLFAARAAEGLRDRERGRILVAYGASERTPMLALKVQKALVDLNLLHEAIFPHFNRYHGAEAIGSAADLYVLRPTTKTWPAIAARLDRLATAIYTQGPQAVESAPAGRPDRAAAKAAGSAAGPGAAGAADRAADEAAVTAFGPGLLAGDWPRGLLPQVPRTRLATLLAKPYAADPERVAIAVPAGLEAALPRLLLATRARHVRVLLAAPVAGLPALAALLAPVYELSAEGRVLDAVRLAPPEGGPDRIIRAILDSAHGKLANTWREALTRPDLVRAGLTPTPGPTAPSGHAEAPAATGKVTAEPATTARHAAGTAGLTKRQARAAVEEAAPWAGDATPLELPLHRLTQMAAEITTPTPA